MYIKFTIYVHGKINALFFIIITLSHFCYSNNRYITLNVLQDTTKLSNYCQTEIKSIKAYKTGFELNQPVAEFNTDETITVEFDDLSESIEQLEYTVIHCNYSWQRTNINFMEYADGFEFNPLYEYQYSSGTMVQYRHYALSIPNSNLKLKLSGNYILQVVKQSNRQEIVLQQQFRVYEPKVKIDALVRQPVATSIQRTHQQVELTVNAAQLGKIDPDTDIVVLIDQNNQPYNKLIIKKPQYIDGDRLQYYTPTWPVFEGGNEFRQLNIKSFHYQTAEVQGIRLFDGVYHTMLTPDTRVKSYRYTDSRDINGKYIIKCDDVTDSPTEADYTWVYFTLNNDLQFDGDIYLFGELTGWQLNPKFRMNFNPQSGNYEAKLFLKQGFYNYKYVFVSTGTATPDYNRIESTFYDTENGYTIYVYFKPYGARYWQLVGLQGVNSRYKN